MGREAFSIFRRNRLGSPKIDPGHDDRFGGCFLVVTEVKPWGFQGYVSIPDAGKTARAYYRVTSD